MLSPSSKENLAFNVALALAETTSLEHLNRKAIPDLQKLLDAPDSSYFRIGQEGPVPLGGTYFNDLPNYFDQIRDQDPIWDLVARAEPRLNPFFPVHAMGRVRFRKSAMYHEFYKHYEMEDMCMVRFTRPAFGTPGTTALMLFRSDRHRPFFREDLSILKELLPAFEATVHRIERFRALENEKLGMESLIRSSVSQPCLVLDGLGKLLWISPLARGLFGPHFHPDHHLPENLLTESKKLISALRGRRPDSPLKTAVTFRAPQGHKVRADLFVWGAEGSVPFVAVLLENESQDGRACPMPLRDLTPAEMRVLEQLLQGLSNRQIAKRLFVSVETIRSHVKTVLAKLGVASRTEAVARVLRIHPSIR